MFKYIKTIPSRLIILATCIGLVISTCSAATPKLPTLTDLSQVVFKTKPTYIGNFTSEKESFYQPAIIPYDQFLSVEKVFFQAHKQSRFLSPEYWLGGHEPRTDYCDFDADVGELEHPFVQRLFVPAGSIVCFMGDLHGDIHSLLCNLWRLALLGYLDNNFKIKSQNFYMIFTGDFVDGGAYGTEVWYTLMLLKLANFSNVFLLRGNHENELHSSGAIGGFENELKGKYQAQQDTIYKTVTKLYRLLPFALFLGSGVVDNESASFVQCCHGGIEIGFDSTNIVRGNGKQMIFQRVDNTPGPNNNVITRLNKESLIDSKINYVLARKNENYNGFSWSDFQQEGTSGQIQFSPVRDVGYVADMTATLKYLKLNPQIKAIFRGHQDSDFGFKLFFKQKPAKFDYYEKNPNIISAQTGPYYWREVVKAEAKNPNIKELRVADFTPVFTFTTAVSARNLTHDSFCFVLTTPRFDEWMLKPFEFPVTKASALDLTPTPEKVKEPSGKYLSIKPAEGRALGDDVMVLEWSATPAAAPVSQSLIDTLRTR